MKFNKIIFYCIAIANIIALERNHVNSLPTANVAKFDKSFENFHERIYEKIQKKLHEIHELKEKIHKKHHRKNGLHHGKNNKGKGRIMITKIDDIRNDRDDDDSKITEEPIEDGSITTAGLNEDEENSTPNIENDNEQEDSTPNVEDGDNDNETAAAVDTDINKSENKKGSIKEFFEKTKDTVIDIYVTMPKADFNKMNDLAQCADYRNAKEFSTENATAHIEINGEAVYLSKVELSLGGASSRAFQKVGYNIKTLNKGESLYGLKNIKLRGDDRDPTHMVSRLSADFIKSAGLVATSVSYARLYINDEYMGLYTLQDVVKKHWIKNYFGEKSTKNCYKCETLGFSFEKFTTKNSVTCTNINDEYADYTEPFDAFVKKVNAAKSVSDLEKIMDVDVLLKYLAFEWIVLSWDHMLIYGHNFYWYKKEDGKWIPIYFDFDITWYISNRVSLVNKDINKKLKDNFPDDDHVFWPNMSLKDWEPGHKIIDILIHQDDTRFRSIVHQMIKNYFNPTYLNKKIDDLHTILKEYVIEDLMFIKDLKKRSEKSSSSTSSVTATDDLFGIKIYGDLEDEKLDLNNTDSRSNDRSESVVSSAVSSAVADKNNNKEEDEEEEEENDDDKKEGGRSNGSIAGTTLTMEQRGRINLYGLNFGWTYDNYYEVINGENYLINTEGGSRSAPLKWTIQHRFNYLCHTYGINPETLELITPRPEVREWSSTNVYKLNATYDENKLVRFNYPNLEKEDFMTDYCKYCEVTKESNDGSRLGFENNKSCIIHPVDCGFEKGVKMSPNGFSYCDGCDVNDIKGGVLLGMENGTICEILTDNC